MAHVDEQSGEVMTSHQLRAIERHFLQLGNTDILYHIFLLFRDLCQNLGESSAVSLSSVSKESEPGHIEWNWNTEATREHDRNTTVNWVPSG